MANSGRIYYVEDDAHIRDLTTYALRQAGFDITTFPDGTGFVQQCISEPPDIILLDIMLPGGDGLTILNQLRNHSETEHIPIMMLTAKGTEYDTICGLDAGADDYLAKPFGMMELISRVNALLRRAARSHPAAATSGGEPHTSSAFASADEVITRGPISLSIPAHSVTVHGVPVTLTVKEFDLLRVLMENEHRVLSRDRLLALVWDIHYAGETRTVDAHIKTLRQKLSEAHIGAENCIGTIRGVGYVFRGDGS